MEAQSTAARRGPKPKPDVRDNLLRAGVELFHARGYTATGIKDIVAAAHVPKGSFYNYFDNKETFGTEVIDFFFERRLPKIQALLSNPDAPPLERLRHYFELRIDGSRASGYVRGCLLGNFSLEVADQSPLMRERLAVHFRTWSQLLETCIEEARRTGALNTPLPPSVLARFILNSWEGALLRMRAEKSDGPLNEFMTVVFGTVLV